MKAKMNLKKILMHTKQDIEYEIELEKEWQSQPKPNDYELLQIFPEGREYYLKEFRLLITLVKSQEAKLEKAYAEVKTIKDETVKIIMEEVVKEFILKDLIENRKRLDYLGRLLFPDKSEGITEQDIAAAKKNPRINIWDLAGAKDKRFINCPFHGEKTPSLHLYKNKQGEQIFYCFGCGEKGSIIDFVMKTQNLDFVKAVKTLL
jgi:hypothetical protein